jgi:pre-mRNA-splicing helicase BRR2
MHTPPATHSPLGGLRATLLSCARPSRSLAPFSRAPAQELEDSERKQLLSTFKPSQLADVARMCNHYPSVDLAYEVEDEDELTSGDSVVINVTLARDADGAARVHSPRFPKPRDEGWWLVVGEAATNSLVSIKRVSLQQKAAVKLDFVAPAAGEHVYTLYFMCDSYLGCDQEYELKLNIGETEEGEDEEEEDDDEAN